MMHKWTPERIRTLAECLHGTRHGSLQVLADHLGIGRDHLYRLVANPPKRKPSRSVCLLLDRLNQEVEKKEKLDYDLCSKEKPGCILYFDEQCSRDCIYFRKDDEGE